MYEFWYDVSNFRPSPHESCQPPPLVSLQTPPRKGSGSDHLPSMSFVVRFIHVGLHEGWHPIPCGKPLQQLGYSAYVRLLSSLLSQSHSFPVTWASTFLRASFIEPLFNYLQEHWSLVTVCIPSQNPSASQITCILTYIWIKVVLCAVKFYAFRQMHKVTYPLLDSHTFSYTSLKFPSGSPLPV